MDIQKLKSAVAAKHGPLCVDHTPIAVSLNLHLKVDPTKGIQEIIAISTAIRPRRGKVLDGKRKQLFQDALDDGDAFDISVKTFMNTQPVEWTQIIDSLSTIGLQGPVLTHGIIETAMRAAFQQDELVQDQPAYAIRKKKLCTAAEVLKQVVRDSGEAKVDLTAKRNTCLQGMQLLVEDLHEHCMRAYAKAIEGKATQEIPKVHKTQPLKAMLVTWQSIANTASDDWGSDESKTARSLMQTLVQKCALCIDTPHVDDDCQTWVLWANGVPDEKEGMLDLVTRMGSQVNITVLNGELVHTQGKCQSTRSQLDQIRAISNKPVHEKLGALIIDNKGDLPHGEDLAFTGHDILADHILKELEYNAGDKGSGKTAYAFTAAIHNVLFDKESDWRGRPVVKPKPHSAMKQALASQVQTIQEARRLVHGQRTSCQLALAWPVLKNMHIHDTKVLPAAFKVLNADTDVLKDLQDAFDKQMLYTPDNKSQTRCEMVLRNVVKVHDQRQTQAADITTVAGEPHSERDHSTLAGTNVAKQTKVGQVKTAAKKAKTKHLGEDSTACGQHCTNPAAEEKFEEV